jgi:hypothetical protein
MRATKQRRQMGTAGLRLPAAWGPTTTRARSRGAGMALVAKVRGRLAQQRVAKDVACRGNRVGNDGFRPT